MAISANSRMRECGTASAEAATVAVLVEVGVMELPVFLCRREFVDLNQRGGIVASVAGVAVLRFAVVERNAEPLERQVAERVRLDVPADLFDAVMRCDQL